MLILQTTRDELLKPLQTISGIVERRHTMPILSNVLIENKAGQVVFFGTDLEIQMSTLGPKTNLANFSITTNIKKLLDILRALPDTSLVSFELNENQLTIKSGKGRYNLQVLPSKDFPIMSIENEIKVCFTISQNELHEMLSLVQYSMAAQDIRYYLMGMLLQVEDGQLRMVATDGHRLGYINNQIESGIPNIDNIIVPRKTVLELYKSLNFPDELVTVEILTDKIKFSCNHSVIISKVIDSKFPNYKAVIPLDNNNIFITNRSGLLATLDRVSILANEKLRGVNLQLRPGLLTVSCSNNEQEEAQEELEIAYQGDSLDMAFNIDYLKEVLRNIHQDDIQLAFGNEKSSAMFTIPNNEDFKYIVMPMRI